MPDPSQFRHYQIVQDADGNNVELVRNGEQVAVMAIDTQRLEQHMAVYIVMCCWSRWQTASPSRTPAGKSSAAAIRPWRG